MNRAPRKRGGKAEKRGLSGEQVPVLVARDRAGSTADFILDADDSDHIVAVLKPLLARDAIFCSDGSKARPSNRLAGIALSTMLCWRLVI